MSVGRNPGCTQILLGDHQQSPQRNPVHAAIAHTRRPPAQPRRQPAADRSPTTSAGERLPRSQHRRPGSSAVGSEVACGLPAVLWIFRQASIHHACERCWNRRVQRNNRRRFSLQNRAITDAALLASKARLPARISESTMPNAKMSLRESTEPPWSCSGDM